MGRGASPPPREDVCGDHPIAVDVGGAAALFGVIDGLGHGEGAAKAAQRAAEVVDEHRSEPLDAVMERCHLALTETRGVAMTLARMDFDTGTMSWIGVGNVAADVVAKHPTGVEVRSSALLAGGIIGYRMPRPCLAIRCRSRRATCWSFRATVSPNITWTASISRLTH